MNTEKVTNKIFKDIKDYMPSADVFESDIKDLIENRLKKEIKHEKNKKRRQVKRIKFKESKAADNASEKKNAKPISAFLMDLDDAIIEYGNSLGFTKEELERFSNRFKIEYRGLYNDRQAVFELSAESSVLRTTMVSMVKDTISNAIKKVDENYEYDDSQAGKIIFLIDKDLIDMEATYKNGYLGPVEDMEM